MNSLIMLATMLTALIRDSSLNFRWQNQGLAKRGRKEARQKRFPAKVFLPILIILIRKKLPAFALPLILIKSQETKEKEAKARARAAKSAMRARSEAELRGKQQDGEEGDQSGGGGGEGENEAGQEPETKEENEAS